MDNSIAAARIAAKNFFCIVMLLLFDWDFGLMLHV